MQQERRQLGLGAAIAIVTGESIALGIFLTPATMAKPLGSPLLLALLWLAMGGMTLCGALCYAHLAVRFPQSGGDYIYLRAGYGETIAFLYGWMTAIVMYPGVAAALAVGAGAYAARLLPAQSKGAPWVPAALLLFFAAVNLLGTRLSGRIMSSLNSLKLAVLLALVGWAAFSGHSHLSNLMPVTSRRPGSDALFPAIAGAIVSAFFSFGGWWEAGKIAGALRDPRRNLPLAFLAGVSLVTVVYLLISATFISVLPIGKLTSDVAFVAQFGAALFGSSGARILSACVLICVAGGLAALTMAAPRVAFAMAKTGNFFAPFAKLHPRFGTPAAAILLQTVLSLAVLRFGAFDRVLSYIIFPAVTFLALTASTLFRLPQPPSAWWFPAAPILFTLASIAIALLILLHDPWPALIGAAIVLCGAPLRRLLPNTQSPASALPGTN